MRTEAVADSDTDAVRRVEWPLERVLFALAGTMTLISAGLSAIVSPWFLLLSALVGVNQWLFVLFGACPASLILRRLFSLPSVLYPDSAGDGRRDRHSAACPTSASQLPGRPTTATTP
jgi:hypothetical protein